MATYQISQASSQDVLQIANMSSNFTATDPLINAILRDSSGGSSNPVESRRAMALHNYTKGLLGSIGLVASSFVFKSCGIFTPHLVDASAWIQHFHQDPYWHVPWRDEPGTFDIPPDCVDANLYHQIENFLHTTRKTYMQGKQHYYIRQLDFRVSELQTAGKDAAKYLLAHISRLNPQVDKFAHVNGAHHDLLQYLGWEYVGHVSFTPDVVHSVNLLPSPLSTGGWVLRGVLDLNKAGVVARGNSNVPLKPMSAE